MESLIKENEELENSNFNFSLENELLKNEIKNLRESQELYEKQICIMQDKKNVLHIAMELQHQRLNFLQKLFLEFLPSIIMHKKQNNATKKVTRRCSI